MGYRQPRVPEYREKEGAEAYLKTLVFFLKDFALAAWTADNRRGREIRELRVRVEALEKAAQAAGGGSDINGENDDYEDEQQVKQHVPVAQRVDEQERDGKRA